MSGPTSVVSGKSLRVLALAVAAFSLGFGTRALILRAMVGNGAVLPGVDVGEGAENVGIAPEIPPPVPRPSLAEVLSAPALSRLAMTARFLDGAGLPEIVALAEAWEFNPARATEAEWKLVLGCWAEKDAPAALEAATRVGGKDRRFTNLVLLVWTENAPAAALAHAETDPDTLLPVIIATLARTDMALALDVVARHGEAENLLVPILRVLAETDPADAMARAGAITRKALREKAMQEVAAIWAKSDPEAALAWLAAQEGDPSARALAQTMLISLIQTDPEAAEHHLRSLPPTKDCYEWMKSLAEKKAESDPSAALAWAKGLPGGNERQAALAISIAKLADGNAEKLFALLDEVGWDVADRNPGDGNKTYSLGGGGSYAPGSTLDTALSKALENLAREDPQAALHRLGRLPDIGNGFSDSMRAEMTDVVLRNWAIDHPRDAMAWLSARPDAEGRVERFTSDLVREMSDAQRQALFEDLSSIRSGTVQRALLESEIREGGLLSTDPDRLITLAQQLPASDRDNFLGSLVRNIAATDQKRALGTAAEIQGDQDRQWAYSSVIASIPLADARAAFDALPSADRTPHVYQGLVKNWMNQNEEEASRWVTQLPAGEARGQSAAGIVMHLAFDETPDFAPALQWANSIADASLRATQTEMLFRQWLRKDHGDASAAMAANPLAFEIQNRLLEESR